MAHLLVRYWPRPAARDLPSSAHALDGLADIVAQGKDTLAAAAASSASSASPPSADAESDLSSASGHLRYYSRFEAQLHALQSDPATFAADPDDAEDFAAWRREAGFSVDERQEEIEALCYESDAVEGMLDRLVPDAVDAEMFWARYFYRVHRLKQQEDARAKLVKRVIAQEEEEDLSWELDDEEPAPEEEIKQASISEEPKHSSNLISLGVSLGFRSDEISVSANVLRQTELDRLTVAPNVSTGPETTVIDDADDDDILDGQILSAIIGNISEVDLEHAELSSDLQASERGSRSSAGKKSRRYGKNSKSKIVSR
ncbi:uncharacterized protein [Lolium perenne]|uniref:uncharacterized protein n=1 Tax=Lolium perenne TaxID=4522 RepID=UPI003A98E069